MNSRRNGRNRVNAVYHGLRRNLIEEETKAMPTLRDIERAFRKGGCTSAEARKAVGTLPKHWFGENGEFLEEAFERDEMLEHGKKLDPIASLLMRADSFLH
jgi:hypothetical protein